jgi:hypothetical protein
MRTYVGLYKIDGPEVTVSELTDKAISEAQIFFGSDSIVRIINVVQDYTTMTCTITVDAEIPPEPSPWRQESLFPDWDALTTPWWRHL